MDSTEAATETGSKLLLCSTGCGDPRADQNPEATNRHCKRCRAAATRRHMLSSLDRQFGKGFVNGVKAMRDLLAGEFQAQGLGSFTGIEIAALIRQAPGPKRLEEPDPSSTEAATIS